MEETKKELAFTEGKYVYKNSNPSEGKWEINYSNILTKLIQAAGSTCESYASDLFIDWPSVVTEINQNKAEEINFLFGFRDSGIDYRSYTSQSSRRTLALVAKEYKQVYLLNTTKMKDKIYLRLYEK